MDKKKNNCTNEMITDNETPIDPLVLELGEELIPLVEKEKGTELLEKIPEVRRQIELDIGLVVPKIRIIVIHPLLLNPNEYRIKIKDKEAGNGIVCSENAAPIIIAHFTEIIKTNAAELLDLRDTVERLYQAELENFELLDKIINQEGFSPQQIHEVLINLLKEQISIRNMVGILEIMIEYGKVSKDTQFLVEKIRQDFKAGKLNVNITAPSCCD